MDGIWATREISGGSTCRYQIGILYGKYEDEDIEKVVKPAFGFWMFPVTVDGVLGKVPSSNHESDQVSTKQILDMSKHWPGFGLMRLH